MQESPQLESSPGRTYFMID